MALSLTAYYSLPFLNTVCRGYRHSMTINVRFFASLRERIGVAQTEIQADSVNDVRDVWLAGSHQPLDEEMLVAINRNYASLDHTVADGDEVAFFPPVTGG